MAEPFVPRRMTSDEYNSLFSGSVSFDQETPGQQYSYESEDVVSDNGLWRVRPGAFESIGAPDTDELFVSHSSLSRIFDNQFGERGQETIIRLSADHRLGHPVGTIAPARIGGYEGDVSREIEGHILSDDEDRVEQAIWMQKNKAELVQQRIDLAASEHIDLLNRDVAVVSGALPNGLWIATLGGEISDDQISKSIRRKIAMYRFAQLSRILEVASIDRTSYGVSYRIPVVEPVVVSEGEEVLLPARTLLAGIALRLSASTEG